MNTPTTLSTPENPCDVAPQQGAFRSLWNRLIERGVRSVALYGAGKHSAQLLRFWPMNRIQVTAIFDDNPMDIEMAGIPIYPVTETQSVKFDAVVISSDAYESYMMSRVKTWAPENIPLFDIYGCPQHTSKAPPPRIQTRFKSCSMCDGLFIKANGALPCWCAPSGYPVDLGWIEKEHVGKFLKGKIMQHIRSSWANGKEPFTRCKDCIARKSTPPPDLEHGLFIHLETTTRCQLFCRDCLCTCERRQGVVPRADLKLEVFEKAIREIYSEGINLYMLAACGNGEPALNPRLPDMCLLIRQLYPKISIYLSTNGNFGPARAEALAHCGINDIAVAIDGCDQESYLQYRERGRFQLCIDFLRTLVQSIAQTGSSTRVAWKYILFAHNDRDEQLLKAIQLAEEIGVPLYFHKTISANRSRRPFKDVVAVIGRHRIENAIDEGFYEKNQT